MKYTEIINTIITNDATIEAVAVAITLGRWFRGACQDAIDSGRITREWWKNHGKVYATMVALVMVLVLCALTAAGLIVWCWVRDYGVPGAKAVWTFVNAATNDGLGLYGPSPILQEWFGTEPILLPCEPLATVGEVPSDAQWAFARFGRYQGEMPEDGELVEWANGLKA